MLGQQARARERHSNGILKIKACEVASIQTGSPQNPAADSRFRFV
jgi:hypothetical protein